MAKKVNNRELCFLCGGDAKSRKCLVPLTPGLSIYDDSIYICDQCLDKANFLCEEMLSIDDNQHTKESNKVLKPKEIKAELDKYVIGQEQAKITLSVAVYNHYQRVLNIDKKKDKTSEVEIQKSNVILLGPTGVGKTLLAQTLAKILDVPFAIADATTLTEAGYVGEDVENILLKLVQAANYDFAKAEKGIIFIDEIDKIARKSESRSITRDVSGEGVQQALLKIVEGTVANIPPQGGRKHPMQDYIQLNTTNILFICGGAFDGIDEVIKKRLGTRTIGFDGNIKNVQDYEQKSVESYVENVDLIKYGLIPELVGRLPVVVPLDNLDEEALVRVLCEPKNALIKQYEALFQLAGKELVFTHDALVSLAKMAIKNKTGARGLRAITESVLIPIMYEVPSNDDVTRVVINSDVIDKKAKPIYE